MTVPPGLNNSVRSRCGDRILLQPLADATYEVLSGHPLGFKCHATKSQHTSACRRPLSSHPNPHLLTAFMRLLSITTLHAC